MSTETVITFHDGYYVDASVAVRWFVTEADSEQAVSLLRDEITCIAPNLLSAEAGNALWAMCRRGDFGKEETPRRWMCCEERQ